MFQFSKLLNKNRHTDGEDSTQTPHSSRSPFVSEKVRRELDGQMERLSTLLDRVESQDFEPAEAEPLHLHIAQPDPTNDDQLPGESETGQGHETPGANPLLSSIQEMSDILATPEYSPDQVINMISADSDPVAHADYSHQAEASLLLPEIDGIDPSTNNIDADAARSHDDAAVTDSMADSASTPPETQPFHSRREETEDLNEPFILHECNETELELLGTQQSGDGFVREFKIYPNAHSNAEHHDQPGEKNEPANARPKMPHEKPTTNEYRVVSDEVFAPCNAGCETQEDSSFESRGESIQYAEISPTPEDHNPPIDHDEIPECGDCEPEAGDDQQPYADGIVSIAEPNEENTNQLANEFITTEDIADTTDDSSSNRSSLSNAAPWDIANNNVGEFSFDSLPSEDDEATSDIEKQKPVVARNDPPAAPTGNAHDSTIKARVYVEQPVTLGEPWGQLDDDSENDSDDDNEDMPGLSSDAIGLFLEGEEDLRIILRDEDDSDEDLVADSIEHPIPVSNTPNSLSSIAAEIAEAKNELETFFNQEESLEHGSETEVVESETSSPEYPPSAAGAEDLSDIWDDDFENESSEDEGESDDLYGVVDPNRDGGFATDTVAPVDAEELHYETTEQERETWPLTALAFGGALLALAGFLYVAADLMMLWS